VSTILTPEEMIASRYAAYGGGLSAGRIVKFTPNGLLVISLQRAISLTSASGVGCVSAVMNPSAPALATAATSSARPTHCIPPCTIGCSTPTSSVNRVLIMYAPTAFHVATTPRTFSRFQGKDAVAPGKCPPAATAVQATPS